MREKVGGLESALTSANIELKTLKENAVLVDQAARKTLAELTKVASPMVCSLGSMVQVLGFGVWGLPPWRPAAPTLCACARHSLHQAARNNLAALTKVASPFFFFFFITLEPRVG